MEILECLVEGVASDGAGLDGDEDTSTSTLALVSTNRHQVMISTYNESPHLHRILGESFGDSGPGASLVTPGNGMGEDLQDNDTSKPSVQ